MRSKPKYDRHRRIRKRIDRGNRIIDGCYIPHILVTWGQNQKAKRESKIIWKFFNDMAEHQEVDLRSRTKQ
jgi:hypothetical protein